MNKRVVITGLGVISSIGIGWKEFWDSLLKGKSGISPVSSFDTSNHFTHNGGEVKNFKPEDFIPKNDLKYMNRAITNGSRCCKACDKRCRLDQREYLVGIRIGVSFGTTTGADLRQ